MKDVLAIGIGALGIGVALLLYRTRHLAKPPFLVRRRLRIGLIHGGTSNAAIFRKQLAKLLEAAGDEFDLQDLQGSMLSDQVRKDERGLSNMALMRKVFGDQAANLHEHAITLYDSHGRFYYDRVDEGIANLEAQIRRHGPIDVLLGFSQGGERHLHT